MAEKASEALWTHRDRVSHHSEYSEGEAFKWYLTDFQQRRDMGRYKTDTFRLFIHYRLKGGQTIKEYYEEKKRLGSLADLKECRVISGLTDGVPPDVELALAGLSFQTSSEWLAAAQRVETSLRWYYIKSSTSLQQTAAANFSAASSAKRM
ncbi:hypothetical protein HPB50_011725 [Hyalomma asiaticum]|uniref:Uncharacterized protein n=1 Tax=Hyalomma asiaticum TaxID=266040 RepID=A0ACB7SER4_HYAAI|nr:hypothetical protein HPB50_011725 [Hyalomma asiaticum]